MGRCSGCNNRPVIKAGAGVSISGAMTAADPLIITAESGGGSSQWSPGDIKYSAAAGAQPGWLVADGSPVSRSTYAGIWVSMGSPDTGDGDTTFNLPDLTGRFPLGADGSHALGATGGATQVVLDSGQIAGHTHPTSSNGTHDHNTGHNDSDGGSASTFREGNATGRSVDTSLVQNAGAHTHTAQSNNPGTADPVPIMPPWTGLTPLIKT